jgi:hypothetical protein
MFVLTTLVYPVVLALLFGGAGLLVDRASGAVLPWMLIPTAGAAASIVASQLTTFAAPIAPSTPYVLAAGALAGLWLGRGRLRALSGAWRASSWQLLLAPLAYVLALAPVLLAGRPSFSSYLALADSAVHMMGADLLIRHGQSYSHLDLHNSYGATIHAYYDTSYPSGADTLLGGSSFLLRLPLMWTFQPFTASMLAISTGPAWVLVRRIGLRRAWATVAALTITLPALVYAYELIGSVKEIVALPLILGLGALVVEHQRWLWKGARAAIPFALIVGAGVGALGVAFGAWALVAVLVLAVVALAQPGTASLRLLWAALGTGALLLLVATLPTWTNLSGSLSVAQGIASTSNPGNLHSPLHPTQLLGVWLGGSYKLPPTGVALALTSVLIGLVLIAVLVGVGNAVRSGWYVLATWFALTVLLWLVLRASATTWADAKTLMLTSPAVVLMAWAGIAALRASGAVALRLAALPIAFALVGGVLVSDALQYNGSNLAPTARYEELASLNARFAGRGPTLFTDFDEYALYELRDMDVGGPDFIYPPPALASAAGGHGRPVQLGRIAPAALGSYPLILTRRDPTAPRPPAAYRLLWRGTYYEVWGRSQGARPALVHVDMPASPSPIQSTPSRARCSTIGRVAASAPSRHARLVGALAPRLVVVPIPRSRLRRPPGWARARQGILMHRPGTLRVSFRLPAGGMWYVWLEGNVMRELRLAIDGRSLGSLAGQLGGNSLVANVLTPLHARLSAGAHTLAITRPSAGLAPGDGGAAVLSGIFLTPAGPTGEPGLVAIPVGRWRSLCARRLQWVELVSTR